MSQLLALLLTAAATLAAVGTVATGVWWLLAPRVTNSVESACTRALAPVVESHDNRIARLEEVIYNSHHPTTLVELADLLELVQHNSPDTPPERSL